MRSTIQVGDAPQAIGPYSQGQIIDLPGARLVYSAGQVGLDPAAGKLVEGGIQAETAQVFRNLIAVLAGAQMTLADVVKTNVFLAEMQDFQAMNEVYARHFEGTPPARTTVAVAGLPRNARVEIEVVAVRKT